MDIIDRVENKTNEKRSKYILYCLIASIILIGSTLIFSPKIIFNANPRDKIYFILPVILYFTYRSTIKNLEGQYVEWFEDKIEFKSRKYKKTTIKYNEILSVDISLDWVKITTINDVYDIDVVDYVDYQIRMKLKNNFTKLKGKLNVIE